MKGKPSHEFAFQVIDFNYFKVCQAQLNGSSFVVGKFFYRSHVLIIGQSVNSYLLTIKPKIDDIMSMYAPKVPKYLCETLIFNAYSSELSEHS